MRVSGERVLAPVPAVRATPPPPAFDDDGAAERQLEALLAGVMSSAPAFAPAAAAAPQKASISPIESPRGKAPVFVEPNAPRMGDTADEDALARLLSDQLSVFSAAAPSVPATTWRSQWSAAHDAMLQEGKPPPAPAPAGSGMSGAAPMDGGANDDELLLNAFQDGAAKGLAAAAAVAAYDSGKSSMPTHPQSKRSEAMLEPRENFTQAPALVPPDHLGARGHPARGRHKAGPGAVRVPGGRKKRPVVPNRGAVSQHELEVLVRDGHSRAANAREQREAIKLKMERWEEQHRHRNSGGFVF